MDLINYLIIPHLAENRVLLAAGDEGLEPPACPPHWEHFSIVQPLNEFVRGHYGLEVVTGYRAAVYPSGASGQIVQVYAMDNLSSDPAPPPGMDWYTLEQIDPRALARPELLLILREWFTGQGRPPGRRVPWGRRGWFREAAKWVEGELGRLGLEALGPVQQMRAWVRSCTLYVETSGGRVYFKAVPGLFSYEPVITRVLAQRHPGRAPQVLAINQRNAWMMTRDFGGTPLTEIEQPEVWAQALRDYARIQIDLTQHTQGLVALGCPDRHVDRLAAQIDYLLADLPPEVPPAMQQSLGEALGWMRNMCWDLADFNVPLSLTHGDLWAGNIIVGEDGSSLYFDWSDSAVSHPFFDLSLFFTHDEKLYAETALREQLQEAYLAPWIEHLSLSEEVVRAAFRLAQPLGFLHQALVYQQVILPGVEARARGELADTLPYLLGLLLETLETMS